MSDADAAEPPAAQSQPSAEASEPAARSAESAAERSATEQTGSPEPQHQPQAEAGRQPQDECAAGSQPSAPQAAAEQDVHGLKVWKDPMARTEAFQQLEELMQQRIAFIDGAPGLTADAEDIVKACPVQA